MPKVLEFLVYIFITAYTPGPNNIMSLSNAVRYGFRSSFPFNLGILLGFSIIMQFCALLGSAMFSQISQAKIYLQILGAGYMLYLAWKTWKSPAEVKAEETQGTSFTSGLVLQFVNPKIYIYGITAMATFILPFFDSTLTIMGFALLLALVGFSGTVAWAMFGAAFSRLLSKYGKVVNPILALLLVYCAISLFL
jgi:cysteine/O-acetylserine efflux protein